MILIHDTTLITGEAVMEDAAILIDGTRIAALGPSKALLAAHPEAERIDGTNRAVMPGFANIHTHLGMTLARGIFEDLSPPHKPPFCGGLSPIPLPTLSAEENAIMVQLGALEAIRSGTTALLEDGAHIASYAEPLAATGLRLTLAERAWDRDGASIGDPSPFTVSEKLADAGMERIARLHSAWHGRAEGRVQVGLAAWAPDMCSPALLQQISTLREKLGALCTIHLNQIWGEVFGGQAAEGFLHNRLVAAHCRCMDANEERLLGKSRASVAFNACIAARRGLSPRISTLKAEGCTIGMGTDNMAEDMVEVMRTGLFMERIRREDGRQPTPEEALTWATRGGYQAMGIADGGWLAPGNKADLITIRTDRAHLIPRVKILSTFVHQGQASDVESVMVDGRWIMRDHKVLTMDEPAILKAADAIGKRAWAGKL